MATAVTRPERTGGHPTSGAETAGTSRLWYAWLGLVALGATVIPAIWILRTKHPLGLNDAFYFSDQAQSIVSGKGWFIEPLVRLHHHNAVLPGAAHPPLWTLTLVVADAIGLRSSTAQLLWACLVGGAAVFMTGLAAREVAGPRAGLIAGLIAAVYPNYWINYGLGLGETLLLLIIAAVVVVSVKLWRRPSYPKAAGLGCLCALAALTRAEQILLIVLVMVPVILLIRQVKRSRRLAYAGVGIATALVLLAPWVGFNLARFSQPTFLSTDSGSTIASANCPPTYSGPWLGYEAVQCLSTIKLVAGDESAVDAQLRHVGLNYARAHAGRVPLVMTARVGRELGLFEPLQQLHLEQFINGRPYWAAVIGLIMLYVLLVMGGIGAIRLHRRRITLAPFVGILLGVVITSMVTFGETRYRVPLDVVLVVLSAVALDSMLPRRHMPVAATDESGPTENEPNHKNS